MRGVRPLQSIFGFILLGGTITASCVTFTYAVFSTKESQAKVEENLNKRIDDKDKATQDKFQIILDTMNRLEQKIDNIKGPP